MGLDLNIAMQLATKAGLESRQILLDYFGKLEKVEKKHMAGLVTEADKASEKHIIECLKPLKVDVVGEEGQFGDESQSLFTEGQTRWLVDPLDGTTNYVHGFPIFCISIALEVDGEVQVALVDVPVLRKTYTAIKGQGTFCNGQPIQVSSRSQLSDSLASTGFFAENKEALSKQLQIFTSLVSQCRGVRRPGAAAFDLCMVAEGVFDLFWEENLKPWDTAAGLLLVQEAGGQVTTYDGKRYTPEKKNILATNSKIHNETLKQFI